MGKQSKRKKKEEWMGVILFVEQMLCMDNIFISLLNKSAPNMQVTITSLLIGLIISLIIIILFVFILLKKQESHARINNYRNQPKQTIEGNKIIIAIQPNDVFANISSEVSAGFIQLQIERNRLSNFMHSLNKSWGGVVYYKVKDKSHNIGFIQTLLDTNKVQLYIYTKQSQKVTDALLKKLGLSKYFKNSHRKYCTRSQQMKHPTQVDSQTRRVIILTGKKDYSSEDSKYFLIIKRKDLKKYGKDLSELIRNNKDVDDLHAQFAAWKMDHCGYDSSHQ